MLEIYVEEQAREHKIASIKTTLMCRMGRKIEDQRGEGGVNIYYFQRRGWVSPSASSRTTMSTTGGQPIVSLLLHAYFGRGGESRRTASAGNMQCRGRSCKAEVHVYSRRCGKRENPSDICSKCEARKQEARKWSYVFMVCFLFSATSTWMTRSMKKEIPDVDGHPEICHPEHEQRHLSAMQMLLTMLTRP